MKDPSGSGTSTSHYSPTPLHIGRPAYLDLGLNSPLQGRKIVHDSPTTDKHNCRRRQPSTGDMYQEIGRGLRPFSRLLLFPLRPKAPPWYPRAAHCQSGLLWTAFGCMEPEGGQTTASEPIIHQ